MPALAAATNRPGLTALVYRIGTYGVFLERMLDQIHAITVSDGPASPQPTPLSILSTRAQDDPAIALLDAWAVVADILTFYQERIVNEGYLRTATERRSVLELARAIGYELSPGVAASAYLQFNVEEVIGTAAPAVSIPGVRIQSPAGPGSAVFNSGIVDIPRGTQVQSVPAPGQLPQTFETSADFEARVDWNALSPRLSRPQDLALYNGSLYLLGASTGFASGPVVQLPAASVYLLNPLTTLDPALTWVPAVPISQVYLQGTKTGLQTGDRLLLVGTQGNSTQTQALIVRHVVADSPSNQTRVAFDDNPSLPSFEPGSFPPPVAEPPGTPFNQANVVKYILDASISESDLQAFLKRNGWDAGELATLVNSGLTPPAAPNGAYVLGAKASFFGNNAPLWNSLPKPSVALRSDPYPIDWDTANGGLGRYIWTDSQGNLYPDADAYLDRVYPQIISGGWALLESPAVPAGAICQITKVLERSLADYNQSGRAIGLTLKLQGNLRGVSLGSPSAVSWAANRLDIFAVGLDGNLYHRWWDGRNWGGPENRGGGNLINSPSAVSWAANRLDIFAIGADGNLYHWWWDGNWGGPENRGGGNLINSPSAVSWAANRLDIFAIGADGNVYHLPWDGSNWDAWENRGGTGSTTGITLINSPSAVSWAANRLDVFAVGSDGNLYHTYWSGSNWGTFENLGDGTFVNSPSAVSWAANRLDIFAVGSNGNLHHKWWNGNNWGGPEDLGGNGNLMNAPSAVSWATNRLDIFVVGPNGHWFHKAWWGSWYGPEDLGDGSLAPFPVRTTTAYIQSLQQAMATLPVVDDIPAGTTELMLDNLVLGLIPGQPVVLGGIRSDARGVAANEIALLQNIVHMGGFTALELTKGLQYRYVRSSLTVNANVTLATHGATVQEVLGNGDASKPNQTFTLSRPPLTYVSAPTASGSDSTLHVRVNGLEWEEAPTLYGLTARDQDYIVRIADDATPTVTFGDPAARPRTGQQNVTAAYRTGIGLGGNVSAGSLSLLQSRPPGLRGVTNPLPAGGGADPQVLADARINAPLTVLTLDRIVSLDDYQNYAQAFPGIGKAQAVPVWSGQKRLIHITVAAAGGGAIDPTMPLYQNLVQGIAQAHDPVQGYLVAGYQLQVFNLTATILIDQPTYQADVVMAQVAAALTSAFSFNNRAFAQSVTGAEIITLIQSVAGVIATNLTQLYVTNDPSGPSQTEPPPFLTASPARWQFGTILPAQLLLLNPLGVSLQEMTS